MTALIDVRHVSYTYPTPGTAGRPALDDLSLQIAEGEYVAIVGANGSGKSTLARHLNALLIPQDGYVRIAGRNTRDPTHHPEIRRTVGMVFQRPEDQIVGTVVAHDVAFGLENLALPAATIQRRVESALQAVSLWQERDRPPHMLSAGQMQRLALAGILAMRPACIIFDEATAMLDPAGRRLTRAMMQTLHQQGITILTITHRMDEVLDADRLVVLHQGRPVLDDVPAHAFKRPEQLRQFGLDLPPVVALSEVIGAVLPNPSTPFLTVQDLVDAIDAAAPGPRKPTLTRRRQPTRSDGEGDSEPHHLIARAEGLGHTYMRDTPFARRALHDVHINIQAADAAQGGAHGLIGATGSGKSTLLQHLNGLLRPQEGQIRVLAYDLTDTEIDLRDVRRQVGLVFQRPEAQIFEQYVGDEIAYGPRLAGLDGAALRERVSWAMDLVGLDFAAFKDRFTFALSGGEQRKVALASTLALQPEILLLDEPTAGLDPASKVELMAQLKGLQHSGITLVLSSHEMEDIASLTERVTVLAHGATMLEGSVSTVFSHSQQLADWDLGLPIVTQVSEGLRARGWPLPPGIVDAAQLRDDLADIVLVSGESGEGL